MPDASAQKTRRKKAKRSPKGAKEKSGPRKAATVDELVAGLRDGDTEAAETGSPEAEAAEAAEAGSPEAEAAEAEFVEVEAESVETEGESAEAEPAAEGDLDDGEVRLNDALPVDVDDDLSEVEGDASVRLMSIVESLLFASNKPLGVKHIRRLLKEPSTRQIQLALKQLIADSQERGVLVAQVAGGFKLRTHPENARYVQKLLAGKPARLSRSQLETLAVIAYRQPITRAEIDHVRGVDCSAVLKLLLDRDLVRIVGRKEEPGRPHLYGTSVKFLEFFNLRSLRDMPDLHEFRELTEESVATVRERLGEDVAADLEAMGQERIEFDGEGEGEGEEEGEAEGESEVEPEPAPESEPESEAESEPEPEAESEPEPEAESESESESESEPEPEPEAESESEPESESESEAESEAESEGGSRAEER